MALTSEELEKKVRSFSGHNGLGKTYLEFKLETITENNCRPHALGTPLPMNSKIRIGALTRKRVIYFTCLASVMIFFIAAITMRTAHAVWINAIVLAFGILLALAVADRISKMERGRLLTIRMDEEDIRFNKDRFRWAEIEAFLFKNDIKGNRHLLTTWLIVHLKNDDLYYYDLHRYDRNIAVASGLRFEELLFLYKEHGVKEKTHTLDSFGGKS